MLGRSLCEREGIVGERELPRRNKACSSGVRAWGLISLNHVLASRSHSCLSASVGAVAALLRQSAAFALYSLHLSIGAGPPRPPKAGYQLGAVPALSEGGKAALTCWKAQLPPSTVQATPEPPALLGQS
jgi:hypothetical protein